MDKEPENNEEENENEFKDNIKLWSSMSYVPKDARSVITGGRLKGFTSIKPQWRYEELTKKLGPCGIGWKYEIVRTWLEAGSKGEFALYVEIKFYFKHNDKWSEPIPGVGGSMHVANESSGLRTNDEALKMATTDALSYASNKIGVGASVYMGHPDERYSTSTTTSLEDLPIFVQELSKKAGIPEEDFLAKCEEYNWDIDYIVKALEAKIKADSK